MDRPEGQAAAINQQINAQGISNVVSGERLQELPDVNVAEAIGRLPGLMVERNRGRRPKDNYQGTCPKIQYHFNWWAYGAFDFTRRQEYRFEYDCS
jgi:hypothetical protein